MAIKKLENGLYTIIFKKKGYPIKRASRWDGTYTRVRKQVINWVNNETPEWQESFEDLGYIRDISGIKS